jgi:pyridinium-3,5-biscarboxylic acid mononucleotide synthase
MKKEELKRLLDKVKAGELDVENALAQLEDLPFKDLGFAKIDNHRELRTGYPEVVFCSGKTVEQVRDIVAFLNTRNSSVLATRATEQMYNAVRDVCSTAEYHLLARTIVIRKGVENIPSTSIAILSAGTSDIPIAEEAAITAEVFGNKVLRVFDVGVAGIHRLYESLPRLKESRVVVVVAGMEGALPSIVKGLIDKPVIAVPTSIGYGANFGGLSALLGMLTSCSSGISVVNIDNGFGAGYLASMINKL